MVLAVVLLETIIMQTVIHNVVEWKGSVVALLVCDLGRQAVQRRRYTESVSRRISHDLCHGRA